MKLYETAPEDSRQWKCNWFQCEHGIGLAGSGRCTVYGDWKNKNCEYFEQSTCEHGTPTTQDCEKCQRRNREIELSLNKRGKKVK